MSNSLLNRRELIAGFAASAGFKVPLAAPPVRSFWLFKLLRPECVIVRPLANTRLHCSNSVRQWIVEGNDTVCVTKDSDCIRITGPYGSPVQCALEVPALIRRAYSGVFELRGGPDYVLPAVSMDSETATSCIVGAELPVSGAGFQALAAQAVVSRSVVLGSRKLRHGFADFCDTTHCQFLRSPAPPGSLPAKAVEETRGYALFEGGSILPARYSAACGGRTEAGFDQGHSYVSVRCAICENQRTTRRGHGWGLCQEGAIGLAQRGLTWCAILATYYPNAVPVIAGEWDS